MRMLRWTSTNTLNDRITIDSIWYNLKAAPIDD